MPRAFLAARHAYLCAQATNGPCVGAVPGHIGGRHSANGGAIHVETNTLRHHLDVVLLKARVCAVVASIRAHVAGLDARLIPFGTIV